MAKDRPAERKFEEHLAALEKAVGALEGGQLGLEESLQTYEEGVAALKRCHEILDKAEKRVQILLKGESGEMEPQPFDVKKTADREKEERKKHQAGELGF
jgi:exodeoxyribonuclease VII small subunit